MGQDYSLDTPGHILFIKAFLKQICKIPSPSPTTLGCCSSFRISTKTEKTQEWWFPSPPPPHLAYNLGVFSDRL